MDDCTLAFLVSGLIALCGAGRLKNLKVVSYQLCIVIILLLRQTPKRLYSDIVSILEWESQYRLNLSNKHKTCQLIW